MPVNEANPMNQAEETNQPSLAGGFGYLKINVAAARRALPVYDAQVAVYSNRREEQRDLLALLQTDESGGTEVISLPAPALANSLSPGQAQPYNTYYLRIVAANFVTRDQVPVQIFPGVESDLVVNMQAGLR